MVASHTALRSSLVPTAATYGRSPWSSRPTTHKWPVDSTLNRLAEDRREVNRRPRPLRWTNQLLKAPPPGWATCSENPVAFSPPQDVGNVSVGVDEGMVEVAEVLAQRTVLFASSPTGAVELRPHRAVAVVLRNGGVAATVRLGDNG